MKTITYFALLLTFACINANAQNTIISGKVSDVNGVVQGAKITDLATKNTVITNHKGEYKIAVSNPDGYLKYKYNSLKLTHKISKGDSIINITLLPNEKQLYKMILKSEQLYLCDTYLNNYPNGKHAYEVASLKEKYFFIEAYNLAASKFSDTALQNYLKLYPQGTYCKKALDAIEIAAWQNARYNNTIDAYNAYLEKYPNGKAASMAKEQLAKLK